MQIGTLDSIAVTVAQNQLRLSFNLSNVFIKNMKIAHRYFKDISPLCCFTCRPHMETKIGCRRLHKHTHTQIHKQFMHEEAAQRRKTHIRLHAHSQSNEMLWKDSMWPLWKLSQAESQSGYWDIEEKWDLKWKETTRGRKVGSHRLAAMDGVVCVLMSANKDHTSYNSIIK